MPARPSVAIFFVLVAATLVAPVVARADTAAPFTAVFGRLLDPAVPGPEAPAVTTPGVQDALPMTGDAAARHAAIECLALAITYEAGHEPLAGQAAVAQVILNRVRHPAFPKSVCDVVYQGAGRRTGCQFSFICDGSLARRRSPRVWSQALTIAAAVLDGQRDPAVGGATFYHANYVSPYWAPALVRVAAIGAHIFYRFPGAATFLAPSERPATIPDLRNAPVFAPWGLVVTGKSQSGPM